MHTLYIVSENMLLNRYVVVETYGGERYEGTLRRSQASGFLHIVLRNDRTIDHLYIRMSYVVYIRISRARPRKSVEASIAKGFRR